MHTDKHTKEHAMRNTAYLHSLIAEVDNFFFDAGLEPTVEEQRVCLLDPARLTEALAMLDDWEARLSLPSGLRARLADELSAVRASGSAS